MTSIAAILGPPTGRVSHGCYAAPLQDCDGRPPTREHYISKNLLERFGNGFFVAGLPWLDSPRALGVNALVGRVLCERHNNALSPLDAIIGKFYDVIDGTFH